MYIYIYTYIYIHWWNGLQRYFRCISHRFSPLFIGDVCLETIKLMKYMISPQFWPQKSNLQGVQPATTQARNPTPHSKDRSRPAEFSQTASYESNWRCKPGKKRCNVHDQNRGHPIMYSGVNCKIAIKIGQLTISKMGIQQWKTWGEMRSMTTQAVLRPT